MPDLTIEVMQMCIDLQGTQYARLGGYTQTIDREFDIYHCTCPSYKYRKRENGAMCKHLREFEERLCSYHELADGPPEEDGVCPRCGKPTVYVRVGV